MNSRKLLTVFVATGLVLSACGGDDDSGTAAPTTTVASATESPADAEAATVMVATNGSLGDYLVDAAGRTLYQFEQDQGTTTACTGACADNWPPIVADGTPTGGEGIDAAQLATADGILPNQVTYHGHLLYYFAGDQVPGDTNGVGIPSWYAVNPSGSAIENG